MTFLFTLYGQYLLHVAVSPIHKADGRHTTISFEVSKLLDLGLDYFNRSDIWQARRQQILPRCLSNFRAIQSSQHPISLLRDFMRSCGKASVRLVNRDPANLYIRSVQRFEDCLPFRFHPLRDFVSCAFSGCFGTFWWCVRQRFQEQCPFEQAFVRSCLVSNICPEVRAVVKPVQVYFCSLMYDNHIAQSSCG